GCPNPRHYRRLLDRRVKPGDDDWGEGTSSPLTNSKPRPIARAGLGTLAVSIRRRSGDDRLDPFDQLALGQRADLGGGDLAALEEHQGRYALDAVFLGRLRIVVDVELRDGDLLGHVRADLLQGRGDLLARAAPFGPEIDEHGLARLEHVGVEAGV